MTPREKATELVKNYYQEFIKDYQVLACMPDEIRDSIYKKRETFAKKCALIAVDECIESTKQLIHHYTKGDDKRYADIYLSMSLSVAYWKEVKQEIENL